MNIKAVHNLRNNWQLIAVTTSIVVDVVRVIAIWVFFYVPTIRSLTFYCFW